MNWFTGSIPDAIAESRQKNKIFLVYIEGNDEMSTAMTATFNNPVVVSKLPSSKVVPLKLTNTSQHYVQFSAIFPVLVIPSTFFIGKNGTPLEIITGNMDSSEFVKKIDSVFEIFFEGNVSTTSDVQQPAIDEPSTSQSCVTPLESLEVQKPGNQSVQNENLPSTSSNTSNESIESQQTLEDKVERAKALIEIRKQEQMRKDQERLKNEEIERRNMGRAMMEAQKLKKDAELQDLMKSRAKEKEEERVAREAVRAQIAQDKADRAARYQRVKEAEQAEREKFAHMQQEEDRERAARNAAITSNDARLQFRLPDGSFTSHCFTADSTLEEARQFVITNVRPPFSNFMFCTTFPRRQFTESNYPETLRDLQLAPSAVLLVLPCQAITSVNSNGDFLKNIFWILVSPFTSIWRFISSFFPGNSPRPLPPNSATTENQQQNTADRVNNQPGPSNEGQSTHRRRDGNFAKKEGNVYRINNQSDDDENNTWNGNSTQQM